MAKSTLWCFIFPLWVIKLHKYNNLTAKERPKRGTDVTYTFTLFNGMISKTFYINFLTGCRRPVDLVLALDSSDSIGADKYNKLLDFGKELARSVNIGESRTRMGVITYANDALVRFQVSYGKVRHRV